MSNKRDKEAHRFEMPATTRLWSLPVLDSKPRNVCGDCQECCTILPINDGGWVKPAGERCGHLCGSGCSLWGQATMPNLCRTYLCGWRGIQWLGNQAGCRPDRLGVIFQKHGDILAMFETKPGAAYGDKACAVVRKFQTKYKGRDKLRIHLYIYQGILWLDRKHTELRGFKSNEANWIYHREPYEHFILVEAIPAGPHLNARAILDFFAANLHRAECRIRDDGPGGTVKEIPRELIPQLQAIASGSTPPEGKLDWMAGERRQLSFSFSDI